MTIKVFRRAIAVAGVAALLQVGGVAAAGDESQTQSGDNACPVGLVSGLDLDTEFGTGTAELTQCLQRRHKVKLVVQVNRFCRDDVPNAECTRPYALGNIRNVIKEYEITHGITRGRDYEIAAIVHGGGGHLLIQDQYSRTGGNQFEGLVKELMEQGVKFYFCQNTTRSYMRQNLLTPGNANSEVIPGIEYVTAGVSAIADFQSQGWTYVQP